MALPARTPRPLRPSGLQALTRTGAFLGTLLLACSSPAPPPAARPGQPPPGPLEVSAPRVREIGAGEVHEHRIAAGKGDYVRVVVNQEGADVAVRLLSPSGQEIASADGVGGRKAPELLSWIAGEEGEFRLAVAPREPPESGRYEVVLEERRPSVPGDGERVAAERAMSASSHLWALGGVEQKRQTLLKLEEALVHWRAAGDRTREVDALNQLGVLHRILGNTETARELYGRALALAREIGDRRGEAGARNNLGVAYNQLGDNAAASGHFRAAVALWESLGDPSELGNTFYSLGTAQYEMGELEAALASMNRALDLQREAGNLAEQPPILNGMATCYSDRGEGDKALAIYHQALDICRSLGDRDTEANILQNMAGIHLRQGELQQALESYTEALRLHRLLGNRGQEGKALSYLGAAYLYLGEADRALASYTEALRLHQETGNAIWEAYTLRDIGWVHDQRNEPGVALEHYRKAHEISVRLKDRYTQALALHAMGRAHLALGEDRKAIGALETSVALYRETGKALGEINALTDLGRAYQAVSEPERAADLFHRAAELSRSRKTLMSEAAVHSAVARLERDRGNLPAAAAAMEAALRIVESVRPKVASQRQRVSFFASRREYYDFYLDLRMRMHERDPGGGHLAAALAASERGRARGLLDLLAEGRIDVRQGISAEIKEKEQEVGHRISLLQSQLLDDLARGGERAARIEAELDRAEEDREKLEWRIRREHPRYAAFRNPSPLAPERIQELLDERSALLEYAVGREASYLFVVTRDGLVGGYRLPPAAELAESVDAVRQSLRESGRRQYGRYLEEARKLYDVLVAPAEPVLRNKPRLIVSPDGPLLLLSFEALLTGPPPASGLPYENLPYLLRERSVTYVPSASVFAELGAGEEAGAAAPASAGESLMLGFADPSYGSGAPAAPGEAASPLARSLQEAGLPSPRRLPESRNEMLGIAGLHPPGQFRLYLDGDASEENVKTNPSLKSARRIHFAVHGFVNEARPELSGLVLALDEDPREDGLLQVYEIFNLELSADLVVLSACDTALGKNVQGEGLLGVSRALLYAGASSVVMSLWQVSDASTSDLMVRFYRHLNESGDKAEALRLSKLELIREGRYSHPFHWAPFVLTGQPGSAVTSRRLARQ